MDPQERNDYLQKLFSQGTGTNPFPNITVELEQLQQRVSFLESFKRSIINLRNNTHTVNDFYFLMFVKNLRGMDATLTESSKCMLKRISDSTNLLFHALRCISSSFPEVRHWVDENMETYSPLYNDLVGLIRVLPRELRRALRSSNEELVLLFETKLP